MIKHRSKNDQVQHAPMQNDTPFVGYILQAKSPASAMCGTVPTTTTPHGLVVPLSASFSPTSWSGFHRGRRPKFFFDETRCKLLKDEHRSQMKPTKNKEPITPPSR